jgi:hypothetical protein
MGNRPFIPSLKQMAAVVAKRRGITVDEVLNPGSKRPAAFQGPSSVAPRSEAAGPPLPPTPPKPVPVPVRPADRIREDWDHLMAALSAGDVPIVSHDPVGLIAYGKGHGVQLDAPMVIMRPGDLRDPATAITHRAATLIMGDEPERLEPQEAERIVRILDGMPHRLPPSDGTLAEVGDRVAEYQAALGFLEGRAEALPVHPEVASAYGRILEGEPMTAVLGSEWGARRTLCLDDLDINMQIRHGGRWTEFRRAKGPDPSGGGQ